MRLVCGRCRPIPALVACSFLVVTASAAHASPVAPSTGVGSTDLQQEQVLTGQSIAAPGPEEIAPVCERTVKLTTARRATRLVVEQSTRILTRPDVDAPVRRQLGELNEFGRRNVLLAMEARRGPGCRTTWYRVKAPLQPNGKMGWVRASPKVTPARVRMRLVADLSARRLIVYRDGEKITTIRTAIGAADTPTPIGRFYIDARLRLRNTDGVYGPRILTVAAFSQAYQGSWARGKRIAIHGTNQPRSVGAAASHGCFRVANRDVLWLFKHVPVGTPIEIRG